MLLYYRVPPALPMLLFPVFVALQALFTIGVALILATGTAFFRDVRHLVEVGADGAVLDDADRLPRSQDMSAGLRPLILLSPMSAFVTAYHDIFYDRRWPDAGDLGDRRRLHRRRAGARAVADRPATKTASRSGSRLSDGAGPRVARALEAVPAPAQPGRRAEGPAARAVPRIAAAARRGVLGAASRSRSRSQRGRSGRRWSAATAPARARS